MADFDKIFLSTLSLRRATLIGDKIAFEVRYFYPRSPCGERLGKYSQYAVTGISIHALLAESDYHGHGLQKEVLAISIHALLAESDYRSF